MFWISHLASGISMASSFSQSLLWALRQTLPLVFHMEMIFYPQECSESGIFMLFQKGTFAYWSWFDGMVLRNLHMCGICGRVMHRDLWSYFCSRKGGAWLWLFPLCWQQQQSRWRVLLLRAWCFHGKWDGRWRTQKTGWRRHYYPKHFVPWVPTLVMGEFWVMVKGGCHFCFSD